jgi:glycerophosphoryl diester phosphodiesterase
MSERLRRLKLRAADALMAAIPRRVPAEAALQHCKIISHRGEHDNVRVMENTLPAFERARAAGVWGIECDIRWTADLVPVICHDAGTARVFGQPVTLADVTFEQLRAAVPLVPSLAEVVGELGGRIHLMLELKTDAFPDPDRQRDILARTLAPLSPGTGFHILGLDPAVFRLATFVPRAHCILVAEENVEPLCRACLDGGYGGFAGHFLLLGPRLQRRLAPSGTQLGTGFVASGNCLFRELNRGVEWVFSNDAIRLQAVRDRHLRRLQDC